MITRETLNRVEWQPANVPPSEAVMVVCFLPDTLSLISDHVAQWQARGYWAATHPLTGLALYRCAQQRWYPFQAVEAAAACWVQMTAALATAPARRSETHLEEFAAWVKQGYALLDGFSTGADWRGRLLAALKYAEWTVLGFPERVGLRPDLAPKDQRDFAFNSALVVYDELRRAVWKLTRSPRLSLFKIRHVRHRTGGWAPLIDPENATRPRQHLEKRCNQRIRRFRLQLPEPAFAAFIVTMLNDLLDCAYPAGQLPTITTE